MTKIRLYFYLGSGLVAAILPILIQFGVIGADASESISTLIASLGSLLGGGAAITAGAILSKQRKDGTVDAPEVSAIEQAINAIPVVVQQAEEAKANVERLRQAATEAVGSLPVYGKEAQAILDSLPRF